MNGTAKMKLAILAFLYCGVDCLWKSLLAKKIDLCPTKLKLIAWLRRRDGCIKRKQTIVKGLIYNFIDNERMITKPSEALWWEFRKWCEHNIVRWDPKEMNFRSARMLFTIPIVYSIYIYHYLGTLAQPREQDEEVAVHGVKKLHLWVCLKGCNSMGSHKGVVHIILESTLWKVNVLMNTVVRHKHL